MMNLTFNRGKVDPPNTSIVNNTMIRVVVTSVFRVLSSQPSNISTSAKATAPLNPEYK